MNLMLYEMKKTFNMIADYKNDVDIEFANTLIWAASRDLLSRYIFLIKNERNFRDAKIIQNINKDKVIIGKEEILREFSLNDVLFEIDSADGFINYMLDNTIIVENDPLLIREFMDIVNTADEMSGQLGKRYLTRRIQDFKDNVSLAMTKKPIIRYWEETTKGDQITITNMNFGTKVTVNINTITDVFFPTRSFHEREPLNEHDFYQDARFELIKTLNRNKLFRKLDFIVEECYFDLDVNNSLEYFKINKIEKFDGKGYVRMISNNKGYNRANWSVRVFIEPRKFINGLIEEYYM